MTYVNLALATIQLSCVAYASTYRLHLAANKGLGREGQ